MRFLLLLFLLGSPVVLSAQKPGPADTVSFATPENNDTLPAYLRLYSDGHFEYTQIPNWSCWIMSNVSGTWTVSGDTLRLRFELYSPGTGEAPTATRLYRIKSSALTLVPPPGAADGNWRMVMDAVVLETKDDLPGFLARKR